MRGTLVAVVLAALVALSGCSAIDINRPADDESNATDASGGSGGAGAPAAGTTDDESAAGGGGETATEQAADAVPPTATEAATAEPTATPLAEVLELVNDGERDYVVAVTVTNGPVEAVKLARADDSTEVVVLDGRPLDEVLTADTVDVAPVEVVEASEEYEVDPDDSVTETLPGDERRHVLVEVRTDDEATTVVGGAVVTCSAGETVGEVSVVVDGDGVAVTSQCVD